MRVSGDAGKTWPVAVPVEAGPAAYSCLAPLPGGRVGLLYERGKSARITFTVLPLPSPERSRVNEGAPK